MVESSLLILPVSLVGFVLSAMCGFGGKLVLVPVLALWLGAPAAVALSTPVLLFNSLGKCVLLWREVRWRTAGLMALGAVPAAMAGATLLASLPTALTTRLVGVLILVGVLATLANRVHWPMLAGPWLVPAGVVSGVASGLAGAGGPIRAIVLRGAGLSRVPLVATAAIVDVAISVTDIPIYLSSGLLPAENLALVPPLVLTAWMGIWIGRTLVRRMVEPTYRVVFGGMLVLACLRMLV